MRHPTYNRAAEDIGNILALEHVNLRVPDQQLATRFYVGGLGLTRDPYMDFGTANVWINAGQQQFHLPTGEAQVLRGEIGLNVPELELLNRRLEKLAPAFSQTRFNLATNKNSSLVTCPWGNRFRCQENKSGSRLGIPYLELHIPAGTLTGIARFYETVFKTPVTRLKNKVSVVVGVDQHLHFKERQRLPDYDGHHIAIYTPDFSGPYDIIKQQGRILEESGAHQYRFLQLFDPDSGDDLMNLEHEVRSLRHPMFNRPLVNRNAGQTFRHYRQGQDHYYPL